MSRACKSTGQVRSKKPGSFWERTSRPSVSSMGWTTFVREPYRMYTFAGFPAPHACIPAKMQDCKLSGLLAFCLGLLTGTSAPVIHIHKTAFRRFSSQPRARNVESRVPLYQCVHLLHVAVYVLSQSARHSSRGTLVISRSSLNEISGAHRSRTMCWAFTLKGAAWTPPHRL